MKPEQLVQQQPALKDSLNNPLEKNLKKEETLREIDYISFSQLFLMEDCPHKHFERYVLRKESEKTVFTIFGTAITIALEDYILKNKKQSWITLLKTIILFIREMNVSEEELSKDFFKKWCSKNDKPVTVETYKQFQKESFCKSGLMLYAALIEYFKNNLKDWEIVGFEIPLLEPIADIDLNFKGYIDCILKSKTEDKYKILDFKTCSWGWDKEEKTDTAKLYQVILYKKYWCEKNNIPTANVDCAYVLLKRTPSKKDDPIEMFDVTSGDRKLKNAEVWMLETLRKIFGNLKIKTPQSCRYCNCNLAKKRKYY